MMLQLRCLPLAAEEVGSDEHGCVLELAGNPQRLLLTLNLCRLIMPPDTAPLHRENWREIEALVRQLSAIYRQAGLHSAASRGKRYRSGERGAGAADRA